MKSGGTKGHRLEVGVKTNFSYVFHSPPLYLFIYFHF